MKQKLPELRNSLDLLNVLEQKRVRCLVLLLTESQQFTMHQVASAFAFALV